LRSNGVEPVHQKTVSLILVVEDPPQIIPGWQTPIPLQLGRNSSPVDRCDPMISHSGNGILLNCHFKRAGGIDDTVHIVTRFDRLDGSEGEAYVNCDTGHNCILPKKVSKHFGFHPY